MESPPAGTLLEKRISWKLSEEERAEDLGAAPRSWRGRTHPGKPGPDTRCGAGLVPEGRHRRGDVVNVGCDQNQKGLAREATKAVLFLVGEREESVDFKQKRDAVCILTSILEEMWRQMRGKQRLRGGTGPGGCTVPAQKLRGQITKK